MTNSTRTERRWFAYTYHHFTHPPPKKKLRAYDNKNFDYVHKHEAIQKMEQGEVLVATTYVMLPSPSSQHQSTPPFLSLNDLYDLLSPFVVMLYPPPLVLSLSVVE